MSTSVTSPRRHHLPAIPIKPLLFVLLLALIAGGVLMYRTRYAGQSSSISYTTSTVSRGTVTSTVTATGPVSAAAAVPLNFKTSGKVTAINVKVGDKVQAGQVLATLDTSDLQASLEQAQAALANAQASYDKLAQGALPADVAVAQASVSSAANALANARKNLESVQAQINASAQSDKIAVENAQQALADAQNTQSKLPAVVAQQIASAKNNLYSAQLTRDATCGRDKGAACSAANATVYAQQSALDQANASAEQQMAQQQASVDSAQSALKTAQANLQNNQAKNQASVVGAQTQVQSAQDALNSAQASLAKAQAPATKAELDAASAQIASQQAGVKIAQNNLDATRLLAPTDGTVTAINGAVGQWLAGGATSGAAVSSASGASTTSSTQTTMISLTSLTGLQITAAVNEADISKVKIGEAVKFTVDAFAGRTFNGKVAAIQPLGTTTSNVVTYSVLIDTDVTDVQLLPGMTASASIITGQAENTLQVPVAAATYARSRGGQQAGGSQAGTILYVLKNGESQAVRVQLGITDGKTYQVLSGLNEGDRVIVAGSGEASTSQQGGPGGPGGVGFLR